MSKLIIAGKDWKSNSTVTFPILTSFVNQVSDYERTYRINRLLEILNSSVDYHNFVFFVRYENDSPLSWEKNINTLEQTK